MCQLSSVRACIVTSLTLLALGLAMPTPDTERFYSDKLERHVERIADLIVAFNEHHVKQPQPKKQPPPMAADEDGMQSDQPSPPINEQKLLQLQMEQQQTVEDRDKLMMQNTIKQKILLFVNKANGSNNYGERDRSFYANCDQPKSTEDNDDHMKLYFSLTQLEDTIAVANLRLYRKNPTNATASDTSELLLPCLNRESGGAQNDSEKLYRVTVYYHIKGARKHKLKRKIGDSRVVSESMPFINLNVLQGVRELNKGKLFAVIVQIEDQFGAIVKASDFFKGPTCTVGMPTPQPLPTVFEEAHANLGGGAHAADALRKPVPPKLDIKTIEQPADAASAEESASAKCKHVPIRHAHSHHQRGQLAARPPMIESATIISRAGDLNVDMNELRLMLDRTMKRREQQQFATAL